MFTILIRRKTAITIDEKGITEYSSMLCSVGLIEWKDIKTISTGKIGSNIFLSIYVKDNRKYLALSKNPLQTLIMKGNIRLNDTPFFLSPGLLKCNFTELSKIVCGAHEEYKADKAKIPAD